MSPLTSRARRGAAAVEFALILPVVLGILSVTVDYGNLLYMRSLVVQSALDGARSGGRAAPDDVLTDAEAAARESLTNLGIACDVDCTVEATFIEVADFDAVRVRVDVSHTPLFGLVPTPTRVGARMAVRVEEF
jgi:Flp pilus assembly protein TadG